ncbi:AAA family ATPase [Gilvimarinus sp. F26214L]|uniref:AAA family ATPase n=1 Tax=Gilvimarinus sp. DZF01 TaxID=3461371 RepID=UPI0040451B66
MHFADTNKQTVDARAGSARIRDMETIAGAAVLEPSQCTWDDLALPPRSQKTVRELSRRAASGRAVAALLSGPSGGGKTRTAGLIARDLERQLVHVRLSRLRGRSAEFVRATLERVFDLAEPDSEVLLFDEAEALFCRGCAEDDRSPDLVEHFIRWVENFPGVAILATDHGKRINPALVHRLHYALRI